jgi:hypothetical protein
MLIGRLSLKISSSFGEFSSYKDAILEADDGMGLDAPFLKFVC